MIDISDFAKAAGNPLCDYMHESADYKQNKSLDRVWFMTGDPTAYGNQAMRMPQKGYDEMKDSILHQENHGYIDSIGDASTRQAIVKHFGADVGIKPNDVIIVHGANMGLLYCLMSFCQPGDNILIPEIGYPFYEKVCQGLKINYRRYRLQEDKGFQIDLQDVASKADDRTKFMFVINPSNPMGSVFSKSHLTQIIQFAEKYKLPIVCDEVYYGQVFKNVPTISLGHVSNGVPVVVVSGMEKMFSVPGWSTSWIIIYDLKNRLGDVKVNLGKCATIFLHTNVFTQKALPKILDGLGGATFSQNFMGSIEATHNSLLERFKQFDGLKAYPSQGTIYLMITIDLKKFKGFASDKEFIRQLLEEQNVNVFPLSVMGPRFNGFRLLTCATSSMYEQFFVRLKRFVERHRH